MSQRQHRLVVVLAQIAIIGLSAISAWLLRFDFSFPGARILLMALPILVALIAIQVLSGSAGHKARIGLDPEDRRSDPENRKSVVVIGAGSAASMLLRELSRAGYQTVALVDDDPSKAGILLHGIPVAGTVADLADVVDRYRPDELMIAIPSATGDQMRRIIEACDRTSLRFRTIPSLAELLHGAVTVDQLRDVKFEDLLGRDPIHLDVDFVRHRISGRVVMVTGAAGSIGSELCRQLLRYHPQKLVCVDQAETPLFHLQQAHLDSPGAIVYCVADITNNARMRALLGEHAVRVIFHAAAYKHVPLMESNLEEALRNNVFGLLSLLEVADLSGCEDFLLISSDKAVRPASIMGCTKRLGELMIAARPSARMCCFSVRFGNVLGSQGSVVPIFQDQIKFKRQITVTHPDMTRYFMTIPEAVSLVLQAFSVGEKRDILVLNMGNPIRIVDLARTLIRLSGMRPDQVKIVFSGLRPGEKLHEELFYDFEKSLKTRVPKVFRTHGLYVSWALLLDQLAELRSESVTGIPERIRSKLKEIIPQYEWEEIAEQFPAGRLKGSPTCPTQTPFD